MDIKNSDEKIENDILNELNWDSSINEKDINAIVKNGTVTLTGKVNSFNERHRAEKNTWCIAGVVNVINNIKVNLATEKIPTDTELQQRIENKYLWDSDLMLYKINVLVADGIVTLTGTVDVVWKKNWAESLAEQTHGVAGVKNSIVIVPAEDITDEVAAEDISESLSRKLNANELNKIKIQVNQNEVTLLGKVRNYYIWDLILNTAKHTNGVVDVIDQLVIDAN